MRTAFHIQGTCTHKVEQLFHRICIDKIQVDIAEHENTTSIRNARSLFIARPKILLVEDNRMLQTLHMEMLAKIGCNVDLAENGYEAVAMTNQNAYDIIFMDIGLPKLDGISATKIIRQQEPKHQRNIIVAITAYSDAVEKECRDAGMDDFYTKPVQFNKLKNILTYWLPDLLIQNHRKFIQHRAV